MRKRARQALFLVAVLIFAIASYLAVRYAQGYVWDWDMGRFVRTGAISVSVNTDAKFFIDDELADGTSLIGHTAGKGHLAPGTYTLRLVKTGWSSWQKDAEVTDGLLTEFSKVMLLPTDDDSLLKLQEEAARALTMGHTLSEAPTPLAGEIAELRLGDFSLRGAMLTDFGQVASGSILSTDVAGFAIADDNSRILWWTPHDLWVMWTRSTDYQPYRQDREQLIIAHWSAPILGAAWFRDRDHIIVDLGSAGYRVVETDTRGGLNVIRF